MDAMTRRLLAAQVAVTLYVSGSLDRLRSDDRGQASTEYAGILFVVVAIIAAVVLAVQTGVGEAVQQRIVAAIQKVGT